jgi:hypothetical protein
MQEGGQMSDASRFNFQEWLVPPLMVPLFLGLAIVAAVLIRG